MLNHRAVSTAARAAVHGIHKPAGVVEIAAAERIANAVVDAVQGEIARQVEGMCEWRQQATPGTVDHQQFHQGRACAYDTVRDVLLGLPDPRPFLPHLGTSTSDSMTPPVIAPRQDGEQPPNAPPRPDPSNAPRSSGEQWPGVPERMAVMCGQATSHGPHPVQLVSFLGTVDANCPGLTLSTTDQPCPEVARRVPHAPHTDEIGRVMPADRPIWVTCRGYATPVGGGTYVGLEHG